MSKIENLCDEAPTFDFAMKMDQERKTMKSSVQYKCLNETFTERGIDYFILWCSSKKTWIYENATCAGKIC